MYVLLSCCRLAFPVKMDHTASAEKSQCIQVHRILQPLYYSPTIL